MYVKATGVRYTRYLLTIEPKGLGQIFDEAKRATGRCLQHNPEKTKHRCSPESRLRNGGSQVAYGSEKQVGGEPSLLSIRSSAHAKAPQTQQVCARPNTNQELGLQNPNDK